METGVGYSYIMLQISFIILFMPYAQFYSFL